jgi:8-oxo-dGTP pyrophosphatase MutT (NUDIX family)
LFISEEPPHGATVIVLRRDKGAVEYLVLHRANRPSHGCDWAWGPPAGVRMPGEDVDQGARRALDEATGLRLALHRIGDDPSWAMYWAEATAGASILLASEHDRHEWVAVDEAVRRCRPAIVAEQFERLAAVAAA